MTLNDLADQLANVRADMPVVFETDQGPISGGYHITELPFADLTGIDCGGRLSTISSSPIRRNANLKFGGVVSTSPDD